MRRFGDVDGEATSIAYTGGADASGPRAVARARASGTQAAPPGTGRGARLTNVRARYPQRLDPGSALGRAVVDRAVVHVADVRAPPNFPPCAPSPRRRVEDVARAPALHSLCY